MKQRISVEQLQELSKEQKERLREWWKPEKHDIFVTNGCCINAVSLYCPDTPGGQKLIWHGGNGATKGCCLPLFSIGQCLELLQWPTIRPIADYHHDWTVIATNKTLYEAKELIDALWSAVKSVL